MHRRELFYHQQQPTPTPTLLLLLMQGKQRLVTQLHSATSPTMSDNL